MGKSTGATLETLAVAYEPVRYVVTNTQKIILVTHDFALAQRLAQQIQQLDDPQYYVMTVR